MTQPSTLDVNPGDKFHAELVKTIMKVEQVVTDVMTEHSPNEVIQHVNALFIVAGTMIGKLRAVEMCDDPEGIGQAMFRNYLEGVKIGEEAGRRTILRHFTGEEDGSEI